MHRASVLMYHIVDTPLSDREARFCCPPERFERQMAWISKHRNPVGLDQLLAGLQGTTPMPEKAVAVTFDDGFASTFEQTMPVLERYRMPAAMFIVAGRVGAENDWMHSRGFPRRPLMDSAQIREMRAAGVTIGSHTLNHARLPETPPEQMNREIIDSKSILEDLLSEPVLHFAYPYGLFNETARDLVENAGYVSACSTRSGFNNSNIDRYQLRRIEIFGSDRVRHLRQKLKFGTNEASWTIPLKYYGNRLLSRLAGNR